MKTDKRTYGKTYISFIQPWGIHPRKGHRLLCADGVVRAATLALTADTFFSIPASIRVAGKTISGYATVDSADGLDCSDSPKAWIFHAHTCTGFAGWTAGARGAFIPQFGSFD